MNATPSTAYVIVDANIVAPSAELIIPAEGRPIAVVYLSADHKTRAIFHTPAEAYALRDAVWKAGDLLAAAEATS